MEAKYDFAGWATRNDIRCTDGRIIRKDAFKECDGKKVPLVWNHQHNDPTNVLGHAILENRNEGVYAYGTFNDTETGQMAKSLVQHGDIESLSIWANGLRESREKDVLHGVIRELSLVLAGANSGAFIDSIIAHEDGSSESAVIYCDASVNTELAHSSCEDKEPEPKEKEEKKMEEEKAKETKKPEDEETVKDIFDTLTEKQKTVVYAMIGNALDSKSDKTDETEGGKDTMKHNVFDNEETNENKDFLSHSEMSEIFNDAKRVGSLRDATLAHGIDQIDYLFPEAKTLNTPPEFIKRKDDWVSKLMSRVHHTPFSRIKSMFANLTEADARAKGYIKGNLKTEEVFGLLKRTTTPTTIYKKQKIDRDDAIDIVDFDVVAWLKSEMRMMLDEEIARAVLVGDGRPSSSDDKINEGNIRPIWKDDDLFTIKYNIPLANNITPDQKAKAFIRACVKSRKEYRGSGNPILFTTEDWLTDCLLMEDNQGRIIYDTVEKLKTAMRVSEIVTVPVMENLTRESGNKTLSLAGIIVNPDDYNIGADKGGAVNMFDDFDIDYNQQKYLIETRCSGALTKPYSAIALETSIA